MEDLVCKWIETKKLYIPKNSIETFLYDNNNDMKNKLSTVAYKMLCSTGLRKSTIRKRKLIEDLFKLNDIPLFESIAKFQELYGGLSYTTSGYNTGYILDLFYVDKEISETEFICEFQGVAYMNNKYYFNCMNYHSYDERGPFIDECGKIYKWSRDILIPSADSIEEFFLNEGIDYENKKLNKESIIEIIDYEHEIINYVKTHKSQMCDIKGNYALNDLVTRFPKQKVMNLIYNSDLTAKQIADKLLKDIEKLEIPM
ncbi:hypothetical protein FC961_05640 [Clostridium botulinum]|nr:hypothetical protein [Clostridium botulinum]NFO91336.1 hypothetical protein [Clostridium botulinum]